VPLQKKILCFVISKWHVLVNSEVLNLSYIIILGDILIHVPPTKILMGMCPRHPWRD